MDDFKKTKSLNLSLLKITAAAVGMVSLMLLIGSIFTNSKQFKSFYDNKSMDLAATVAKYCDGDYIKELVELIDTDEYKAIFKKATETDDPDLIKNYLDEKGLLEKYDQRNLFLDNIRKDMKVKYVYIQIVRDDEFIYIFDPDDPYLALGLTEPKSKRFSSLNENRRMTPVISVSKYGWLSSAGEPIVDSNGNNVAVAFVDIDVSDIVNDTVAVSAVMLILSIFASIFVGLIISKIIKLRVSGPLEELTKDSQEFASKEGGYKKADIKTLNIHTHDEIEELYHTTRFMQKSLIEYMENLVHVTKEKERIGAELSVATKIQADMLPRIFPPYPDRKEFDIFASMAPAKEVGGDFYDFFLLDEDHITLVMADVSGKGVPAALFMVIAKTLIKNRAMMGGRPGEILADVNNQLMEGNEAELFVTVWIAIIELSTGKGIAANAGHEHPALKKAGESYELLKYKHSPAVAVMEDIPFKDHEFTLDHGDTIFVYTDGLSEATNINNELFGEDRIINALNNSKDLPLKQLLTNVREDVDRFVGDAPQFDDITMLAFQYN